LPEAPEIETLVRDLRPAISGRMITGMMVRASCYKNILRATPQNLYEGIILETIQTVLRRGKYILMPLSNGNVLVFHMGMTGRLLLSDLPDVDFEERFTGDAHIDKHTHMFLDLMDQSAEDLPDLELRFHDPRMFGHIWLAERPESIDNLNVPGLRDLGPDALSISLEDFSSRLKKCNKTVKSFLLDQTKLAGVGNIYADEACFVAKINPSLSTTLLTEVEASKLCLSVRSVLKEGIQHRGSSVSDFTSIDGVAGSYQKKHRVYGKEGVPCVECATPIQKMKIGGRSTHFCPSCQPSRKE
jgi:formamidopyrimidine-DNA glycosylase